MYIENCDGDLINSRYLAYLRTEQRDVSDMEADEIERNYIWCLCAVMLNGNRFDIAYFYDIPELNRDKCLITTFWKEDINTGGTNTIYKTYGLTYEKLIEKVMDRTYFKEV